MLKTKIEALDRDIKPRTRKALALLGYPAERTAAQALIDLGERRLRARCAKIRNCGPGTIGEIVALLKLAQQLKELMTRRPSDA